MATLSGTWTLRAIVNSAGWQQGVIISGSRAHNGVHLMNIGTEIPNVEGDPFIVTPSAFNPDTGQWVRSLERLQYSWDDSLGLMLEISADDAPPTGDLDFDDLVVRCIAEDAELASPHRGVTRPDLTVPEGMVSFKR